MSDAVKRDVKAEGEKPSALKTETIRKAESQITLEHPTVKSGGKTEIGVYVNAVEVSVTQENGVIKLGNEAKNYPLRDELIKAGFADKTDYGLTRATPEHVPSKPKAVKWYFTHPEHTKEHAIDAVVGVYANGSEHEVEFKNGAAIVSDEAIANALEKSGFWVTKTDVK